jgi:cobalt/nickel transport system permease protein
MSLEAIERHGLRDGPLQRLGPRVKLLGTLAIVLAIVATPPGHWRVLAGEALVMAFVIGLSGLSPAILARRWLGLAAIVAFLALLIAPSHPLRPALGLPVIAASIAAKNGLALLAVLTLTAVTPFPRLLGGLRRLGVPAALVETLHFMSRYLHVLRDELHRMALARRSRSFRRSGRLDWVALSGLIGPLFLRAMERGERVHAAMRARGWDGTLRTLDGDDP